MSEKKKVFPKKGIKKKDQQLILNISWYLLTQESLKSLFWNVKSVDYSPSRQTLKIGISTTDGKAGTTLSKLRKCSRFLSDYLYLNGLTFRVAKIDFFIDKEDHELERIYDLLDSFQLDSLQKEVI